MAPVLQADGTVVTCLTTAKQLVDTHRAVGRDLLLLAHSQARGKREAGRQAGGQASG